MIPKVEFRYSWVYDDKYRDSPLMKRFLKKNKQKYPSEKIIIDYTQRIEKIWKKEGNKVLKELSNISGLKWRENKIICYVIGRGRPFSDPLTIPVYQRDLSWFIDVLTHELIHQLLTQEGNLEKSEKSWDYVYKKYKKDPRKAKIHVIVHAIHSSIYLKFFGKKRLGRNIKIMKKYKDYKRSWDIVQEEGYQQIINDFRKRLK